MAFYQYFKLWSGISVKSTFTTTNTEEVSVTISAKKKVSFAQHYKTPKRFIDELESDTFRNTPQRKTLFNRCFYHVSKF